MTENGSRRKDKNWKRHSTAFYMEALALVAVFTVVILVLTKVFALSGQMSARARLLTCAVHLAENAAEAVSASDSPQTLYELLDEGGNVRIYQGMTSRDASFQSIDIPFSAEERGMVCAWYDREMNPLQEGEFRVDISWLPDEADGSGGLVKSMIAVYWKDGTEPVYLLETAVYRRRKP